MRTQRLYRNERASRRLTIVSVSAAVFSLVLGIALSTWAFANHNDRLSFWAFVLGGGTFYALLAIDAVRLERTPKALRLARKGL